MPHPEHDKMITTTLDCSGVLTTPPSHLAAIILIVGSIFAVACAPPGDTGENTPAANVLPPSNVDHVPLVLPNPQLETLRRSVLYPRVRSRHQELYEEIKKRLFVSHFDPFMLAERDSWRSFWAVDDMDLSLLVGAAAEELDSPRGFWAAISLVYYARLRTDRVRLIMLEMLALSQWHDEAVRVYGRNPQQFVGAQWRYVWRQMSAFAETAAHEWGPSCSAFRRWRWVTLNATTR